MITTTVKEKSKFLVPSKKGGMIQSFPKGYCGNPKGRPKGKSKKKQLEILLNDIVNIHNGRISNFRKKVIYNLYEIVLADISTNCISDEIRHLYFLESTFGIKIGVTKNIENRSKQIEQYAGDIKVLKVINFAGNFESNLHNKFKHLNITDMPEIGIEWFKKDISLYTFINDTNSTKQLAEMFGGLTEFQLSLFN